MKNTERLLSIDLTRVIAAIAIIIIHITSYSYFLLSDIGYYNWVITASIGWLMTWGVPIFIMISGYLLINPTKTENFKQFIYRRASKIPVPFIFWNVFYYLFNNNFRSGSLFGFLNQIYHSSVSSHLYFLNIMIGLYLITPILSKLINKINLNIIVPLFVSISAFYHFGYCFLNFPNLNNIFVIFLPYIGYYLAGYWAGHKLKIRHFKMTSLIVFLLFIFSIFITRKLVFIFKTHEQDTVLVSGLSLPVAAFAIVLFYRLVSITNKSLEKISPILIKMSNLTLGIYLIHPFWLRLFYSFPVYHYLLNNHYLVWLTTLTSSIFLISFLSVYLIKKIPIVKKIVGE